MYNGKTKFGEGRRIVVNRRTGIAGFQGVVGDDSDDLSEVAVTAKYIATPAPIYPPQEYDYPEIVVSGNKIPWWAWGIAGVLASTLILKR